MSFVTDVETFDVTDVPSGVMAMPVVTYVAYVFLGMSSACIITFRVNIVIGSRIGVRTIVGSNNQGHLRKR